MVVPVEGGEGGVGLLVGSGLLEQHQTRDRNAVAAACLAALEQWAGGRGARDRGAVNRACGRRTEPLD